MLPIVTVTRTRDKHQYEKKLTLSFMALRDFRLFWLLGFLVVFGCAPIQLQLHDDDLKLLTRNPTVYVVTFKSPPFEVDTSSNVAIMGGVVGGAVGAMALTLAANASDEANSSGPIDADPRALVRSNDYEDPVKQVRDSFVAILRDALRISRFVILDAPIDDDSTEVLGEKFHEGIVLGFRTEEWILEVAPLSSDFWIRYRAMGMFYVPGERRYVWRDICGFMPKDTRASLRELAANSGNGLKRRLMDVGSRCAKQLAAEILDRASRTLPR